MSSYLVVTIGEREIPPYGLMGTKIYPLVSRLSHASSRRYLVDCVLLSGQAEQELVSLTSC